MNNLVLFHLGAKWIKDKLIYVFLSLKTKTIIYATKTNYSINGYNIEIYEIIFFKPIKIPLCP